jgi:hypothetical protein
MTTKERVWFFEPSLIFKDLWEVHLNSAFTGLFIHYGRAGSKTSGDCRNTRLFAVIAASFRMEGQLRGNGLMTMRNGDKIAIFEGGLFARIL